eukprot:3199288-Pyramimonas_sp.AAC.1
MAQLREQRTQAQENRITAILANQLESTLEQRNVIFMIRKARETLLQRPQRHGGLECKRHCVCQSRSDHVGHTSPSGSRSYFRARAHQDGLRGWRPDAHA